MITLKEFGYCLKKFVIDWVWQFPQNFLGTCYYIFNLSSCRASEIYTLNAGATGVEVQYNETKGGITLGKYVFLYEGYSETAADEVLEHELGHVRQSFILGPLYLLLIGLPSILHAALCPYIGCCKRHGSYYHFYTEHWLMG